MDAGDWLNVERKRLWALAYRMLGTAYDAEDVLQDAYLKCANVDFSEVATPPAFLTTTVSRLCIDRLRLRRREEYVGPWLPEPVTEDDADRYGSIHTAFLHLLERLSPKERAVFVLKEALDHDHRDIADMLDITDASSRQLLSRAKKRLKEMEAWSLSIDPRPVVNEFVEALLEDDLDRVESLLCEDVVALTDGGGVVSAAIVPLEGIERIKTVFGHLFRKFEGDTQFEWRRISGNWGLVIRQDGDISVATFQIGRGRLQRVFMVRNPNKLTAFASWLSIGER